MVIKQRKGIIALIVVMIIFLAAAIFISVNKNESITANAAGDIEFTINMSEGGNKVFYDTDKEVQFSGDTVKRDFGQSITFNAEAANYYSFLRCTINWQGGDVVVNGVSISDGEFSGTGNIVSLFIVSGVTNVEVNFEFEAKPYLIKTTAKYITNYELYDDNETVDNVNIILKDISGDEVYEIKIGDTVYLERDDDTGSGRKFMGYALLDTNTGEYGERFTEDFIEIKDSKFLDDHLSVSKELVIVAAYVKTHLVSITGIIDFLEVTVVNHLTGINTRYTNKSEINEFFSKPLEEGFFISVKPKDNIPYYEFAGITINGQNKSVIEDLKDNCTIEAKFNKKSYAFDLAFIDNFGRDILALHNDLDLSGITIEINSIPIDFSNPLERVFELDDTIKIKLSSVLMEQLENRDYFDNYFSIKIGGSQQYFTLNENSYECEIIAESDFLDIYLNKSNDSIKILANLSEKYTFSITLNDSTGLGNSYTILIKDKDNTVIYSGTHSESYTSTTPFSYGTVITIVLDPAKYAVIDSVSAYEIERKSDNTIEILLNNSDRHVNISFVSAQFNIQDATKKSETYKANSNNASGSLEGLQIGSILTISFGTSDNDEIKSWIFKGNGKNYDVLKGELSDYGAEYSNGSLRITLTKKWLDEFGYGINNEVVTGMKTSLLIAIIAPSIAVPILIVILLIFLIVNAKRKKFIKAELLDKKMTGYTYNTGSMIEDLREDNFRKISDKDIKAEMKKKKK